MLLVQDQKISLNDPISKYFPNTPKTWEKITIRHLLNHTSGLADPYNNHLDLQKTDTEKELIAFEESLPLLFQPGEKWAYSNAGYQLLGFICNQVGGKFYIDQLKPH